MTDILRLMVVRRLWAVEHLAAVDKDTADSEAMHSTVEHWLAIAAYVGKVSCVHHYGGNGGPPKEGRSW